MKLFKKASLALVITAIAVMMSLPCFASDNTGNSIKLYINSNAVEGAVLINGTAYAPYRTLVSTIDPEIKFSWNDEQKASAAAGEGYEIMAYAEEHYILANERVIYSELAENLNIDGVLYTPIRSIAKVFSLECDWDGENGAVYLTGTPSLLENGQKFYDEDILYWLSRIISAESRGEPFTGQIAVGNVVMNRTEDGSFPDTVYGVIFDRKFGTQFTPAYSGTIYKDPTDSSVLAAKVALEGVSVVEDALYFCTSRASAGSWMEKNREYLETIGNHVFYN